MPCSQIASFEVTAPEIPLASNNNEEEKPSKATEPSQRLVRHAAVKGQQKV